MTVDQLHQNFTYTLDMAIEDLSAKEQADQLAAGFTMPESASPSLTSAEGVGAFDPTLLLKYLPVVLDALSTLIKKFQSA